MKHLTLLILIAGMINPALSQNPAFYDVSATHGNGYRFWNGNNDYKIHMGNYAENHYGPVQSYSIKMNMSNHSDRGWTWGVNGQTPIAALSTGGIFQLDGDFYSLGNVGIGTTAPSEKLHIEETTNGENISFRLRAPTALGAGRSWHMTGDPDARKLHIGEEELSSDLVIDQNGNVGISTTTPSEKLEVNGTIRTQEVKVETSGWPDYVFADNYQLTTLEEIEAFIKSNKHLPEVPSASEVEANGLKLGEMNALLLKKIEELTLYAIGQEKKNEELKIKNESQQKRLEATDLKLETYDLQLKTYDSQLTALLQRIEKLETNKK